MAKYTKAQVDKWNEGMQNDFSVDLRSLLYFKEKQPVKHIALDDGRLLECKLIWTEERDESQPYWASATGMYVPTLHFSAWTDIGNGMASSSGIGVYVPVGKPQKRRMFSDLQKLTANFPDDECMRLYSAHKNENALC